MSKLRLSSLLAVCLALASACNGGSTPTPQPPTCPEGFEAQSNACVSTAGAISGSVKYADQTAQGGIFVALLGTDRTATTDDTGAFTLTGVKPGTYKLEARATGYRAAQVDSIAVAARATTAVATLKLERDVASTSRVTGTALLGDGTHGNSGTLVFLEGTMLAAFTSATGSYSFEAVPPGTYTLVAQHEGYAEARTEGVKVTAGSGTETGTLRLQPVTSPLGSVAGRVQVEGATSHEGVTLFIAGTSVSAVSGVDGRFTLANVPPGQQTLVATKGGFVTFTSDTFTVTAGTSTALSTFTLLKVPLPAPTVGTVRGNVTRAGGTTGNAGITVYLEGTDRVAYTNDAGAFRIDGVVPGSYTLGAASTGYLSQRLTGVAVTAGQETLTATLNLSVQQPTGTTPTVGSIRGKVTRAGATSGNAGITVYLEGTDAVAYTDDSGAFVLTNVQPAAYALTAVASGFVSQRQTGLSVLANQETLAPTMNLAVAPAPGATVGSIRGKVTRAGASSGNAGITLYLEGTDRVAYSDDTGAFVLTNVQPGTYALTAVASGFVSQRQAGLAVTAGQETAAATLNLATAPAPSPTVGGLRGKVTRAGATSGNAGITVYLEGTDRVAFTDDAGTFSLTSVTPGTYALSAVASGYVSQRQAGVTVTAGQETLTATLNLAAVPVPGPTVGSVRGKVTRAGATSGNAGITVYLEGTDRVAFTDDAGAFKLDSVVPGTYVLGALTTGYTSQRQTGLTVTAGQETLAATLNLAVQPPSSTPTSGTVRGRVLLSGATSHAGSSVFLAGTSSVAVTDATGAFVLTGVTPGTYTLGATHEGFEQGSLANVQVTAGQETATADVTLAPRTPTTVGGTVAGVARILGRTDHRGITARLTGGGTGGDITVATDVNGAYRFTGVPDGVYELVFSATGYPDVRVSNVIAAAGTFQVSDILLRPATRIDSAIPTHSAITPDDKWVVLSSEGDAWGLRAYEVGTGKFVPLATRPGTVVSSDSAGHAILEIDSTYYTSTLATGTLERITPAVNYPYQGLPDSQSFFYMDLVGNLYAVAPGQATGSLLTPQRCSAVFSPYYLQTAPVKAGPRGAWMDLRANMACSDSTQSNDWRRFTQPDGSGTGWFTQGYVDPAGAWALVLEYADMSAPSTSRKTLKRLDFATGALTVVADDVQGLFLAPDAGFGRVAYATDGATGRGKHAALNLATGALTALATDAKLLLISTDNRRAVSQTGASGSVEELRFDTAFKTAACTGTVGQALATPDVVACTIGTGPVTLNVLNRAAGSVSTVTSTAVAGSVDAQGRGVVWKEGSVTKGLLVGGGSTTSLCASTWQPYARSANGRTWVGICTGPDARWVAVDLQAGTSREVLPGAQPSEAYPQVASVTDGGRGVSFNFSGTYTLPENHAWSCTSAYYECTVFFDVETGQRVMRGGHLQFVASGADDMGAFVAAWPGGYTYENLHQAQFTATALKVLPLPAYNTVHALGAQGRFGLVSSNFSGAPALTDMDSLSATSQGGSVYSISRVGGSNQFVLGASVVNLDTGALTPLGTNPYTLSSLPDGFIYVEGSPTQNLRRYSTATGVSLLLASIRPMSNLSDPLVLALSNFDGQQGTLATVNMSTGAVATLGAGFGPDYGFTQTGRVMLRNLTATSGDLVHVNPQTGTVVDLKVRARRGLPVYTTSATRALVTAEAADGTPYLAVVKLDGSGARKLGAEATSAAFSPDGSRAFFTSGQLAWAEDKAGGASIAVDNAGSMNATVTSRSGNLVVYGVGTLAYPESLRNGTYRLDLP